MKLHSGFWPGTHVAKAVVGDFEREVLKLRRIWSSVVAGSETEMMEKKQRREMIFRHGCCRKLGSADMVAGEKGGGVFVGVGFWCMYTSVELRLED